LWDVLSSAAFTPATHLVYKRAVAFYDPWLADERPSLPQLCEPIVEIPVSLPDDEMLIDRLGGAASGLVEQAWRAILTETYWRGELFTIQLHPERIALGGAGALTAVLSASRALTPGVWIARLNEIAAWWRERTAAVITTRETEDGVWRLTVAGPAGTVILARGVEVLGPAAPWAEGYQQVAGHTCAVRAARRPFVGASPGCPQAMLHFLRQQGYIVEVNCDARPYATYLDRADFAPQDEYALMRQIQRSDEPLVRLGCWPNGARSAVAISGDIDALTLWDYGLRIIGR
jgi:hypothetical protein